MGSERFMGRNLSTENESRFAFIFIISEDTHAA